MSIFILLWSTGAGLLGAAFFFVALDATVFVLVELFEVVRGLAADVFRGEEDARAADLGFVAWAGIAILP